MPSEPLAPFHPPAFLTIDLSATTITAGTLFGWFALAVFVFWLVYTLVAVYHWWRYAHNAAVAYPAIALHLFVSFVLAVFILSTALFK
jgi:hypothetical protein